MSEHQVRAYTLSGAAMDVFYKLYHHGPQQDGDLPSKVGFAELCELGLAKKDPHNEGMNTLTKLGGFEASLYFNQQEQAAAEQP